MFSCLVTGQAWFRISWLQTVSACRSPEQTRITCALIWIPILDLKVKEINIEVYMLRSRLTALCIEIEKMTEFV